MISSPSAYQKIVTNLVQTRRLREQSLPLLNPECASLLYLKPQPTSKVILFFHGFTASPVQFVPMGQAFHRMGYNVLAPLLPGHGVAGNWGKDAPPPLPVRVKDYQDFALEWLQVAHSLGDRVVVGGLSVGGTMAAWLAYQRAEQVYRALLFAPYLKGTNLIVDLLTNLVDFYFEWKVPPGIAQPGYKGFRTEALRVFLDMGREILSESRDRLAAPMFVVSSDSDQAVDSHDHDTLFDQAVQLQPKCWRQRFDRVLSIPHTMTRIEEGNKYTDLVITLAKAFVESDLTWGQIKAIGYNMAQGQTFNSAVTSLQLTDKVSPDMPAMMTMVDKRAIVEEYNSY